VLFFHYEKYFIFFIFTDISSFRLWWWLFHFASLLSFLRRWNISTWGYFDDFLFDISALMFDFHYFSSSSLMYRWGRLRLLSFRWVTFDKDCRLLFHFIFLHFRFFFHWCKYFAFFRRFLSIFISEFLFRVADLFRYFGDYASISSSSLMMIDFLICRFLLHFDYASIRIADFRFSLAFSLIFRFSDISPKMPGLMLLIAVARDFSASIDDDSSSVRSASISFHFSIDYFFILVLLLRLLIDFADYQFHFIDYGFFMVSLCWLFSGLFDASSSRSLQVALFRWLFDSFRWLASRFRRWCQAWLMISPARSVVIFFFGDGAGSCRLRFIDFRSFRDYRVRLMITFLRRGFHFHYSRRAFARADDTYDDFQLFRGRFLFFFSLFALDAVGGGAAGKYLIIDFGHFSALFRRYFQIFFLDIFFTMCGLFDFLSFSMY